MNFIYRMKMRLHPRRKFPYQVIIARAVLRFKYLCRQPRHLPNLCIFLVQFKLLQRSELDQLIVQELQRIKNVLKRKIVSMIMPMIVTMAKMCSARHLLLISLLKLNKKLGFENQSDKRNKSLKLLTSTRCSLSLPMEEVKKLSIRSIGSRNLMVK
jgi:hypothetical protein